MSWFRPKRDPIRDEFDAEVLPHTDALYANALRLTHSRADAEDLVQETVLRAFRFYDRFERGTNVKAWLLRIQYNTFVNRYRRSSKEREIKDSMMHEHGSDDVISRSALRALTDPVGTALRPLLLREIDATLATLPEDQRLVVVLADVEELSYKEIAGVLGCPIGTVMSRLHRARRALRKRLLEQAEALVSPEERSEGADEQDEAQQAASAVSLEQYRRNRRLS